jgi:hypothetical protein
MARTDLAFSEEQIDILAASPDPTSSALAREVRRLRLGIREHMSAKGHGLCWLNDLALWHLIEPQAVYPHDTLPVREEFLAQCARFYESRLTGTPYEEPKPRRTVTDRTNSE